MQTHIREGKKRRTRVCMCVSVSVCLCVFMCVCVRGSTVLFPTRHEFENSCRSQRLRVPVQGTQRYTIFMRKDHVLIGHDEIMELQQPGAYQHVHKYGQDKKYEKEDTYSLIVAYL